MAQEAIHPVNYWLNIADGLTALNGAPTLATDGVDIREITKFSRHGKGTMGKARHSATGARTFTVKIWGYTPNELTYQGVEISNSGGWCDTEETMSLASTSTDGQFVQVYEYLTIFERLYCELTAVTGTGTAVSFAMGLTDE